MNKFFMLYDSWLQRNYLVSGKFSELVPLLRIRLFPRSLLDKAVLYLQSFIKTGKVRKPLPYINALNRGFQEMDACLLFRTDWYKETQFIGLVKSQSEFSFIKIFQSYEELFYQSNQFDFIKTHFSEYFTTVKLVRVFENILITGYIPFERDVNKEDRIEEKLMEISSSFIKYKSVQKPVSDILPIDLNFILAEQKELLGLIRKYFADNDRVLPVIPVHGDMTPWNMFVNDEDNVVIVDYETSGWHVPFYDYFHYILQPLALKKNAKSIRKVFDREFSKEYLVLYLIDQIYRHYSQIRQFGFNDKALRNLVGNKTFWLIELLHEK